MELSTAPDDRGIRVGFLTRQPLTAVQQITDLADHLAAVQVDDTGTVRTTMGRGTLSATLPLPDGSAPSQILLVTCSLKRKLPSFPGGRFAPHDEDERARFAGYALDRRAADAVTVQCHCRPPARQRRRQKARSWSWAISTTNRPPPPPPPPRSCKAYRH